MVLQHLELLAIAATLHVWGLDDMVEILEGNGEQLTEVYPRWPRTKTTHEHKQLRIFHAHQVL